MIFIFLKVLHLLALVFGSAASLGNIYLMLSKGPHDLDAPGYTNMLRKMFRLTALGAILLFWASGIVMLLLDGFAVFAFIGQSTAFQIKMAFVIVLTLIVFYLNFMAPGWARRGGPPAYVAKLHWTGTVSLLFAVIFAGAAFG